VNWLYLIPWTILTVFMAWIFYWAGRNTGESAMYSQQRAKHERLREENIGLKLQNERLRGASGYSGEMSNTVTVIDSPGASALADPESASM
jgi:hypothetical protein